MTAERRRFPRYEVSPNEFGELPSSSSVRIVDISTAGALLESEQSATIGNRGRLRTSIGGRPFFAEVEVRRVSAGPGSAGHRIGVMFVDIAPEHQEMIERFTRGPS